MFKLIKLIATVATVVAAASAPSAAYATPNLENGSAPAVSSLAVHNTAPAPAETAVASSSQGFRWDDAGIGGAAVLALVFVGSGATILRRRRTHHPLTS